MSVFFSAHGMSLLLPAAISIQRTPTTGVTLIVHQNNVVKTFKSIHENRYNFILLRAHRALQELLKGSTHFPSKSRPGFGYTVRENKDETVVEYTFYSIDGIQSTQERYRLHEYLSQQVEILARVVSLQRDCYLKNYLQPSKTLVEKNIELITREVLLQFESSPYIKTHTLTLPDGEEITLPEGIRYTGKSVEVKGFYRTKTWVVSSGRPNKRLLEACTWVLGRLDEGVVPKMDIQFPEEEVNYPLNGKSYFITIDVLNNRFKRNAGSTDVPVVKRLSGFVEAYRIIIERAVSTLSELQTWK